MLPTDRQTDNKQTDKLTNATKNITSFAKEVIRRNVHMYASEQGSRVRWSIRGH